MILDPATRGVVIVTGTDTDVGKTVATAVLAREAAAAGVDVAVLKPTQTGLAPGEPGDVDLVGQLAGLESSRCYEGIRLPEPLAPATAARRAGVALPSMADQARTAARLAADHELVFVEGAGGVTVALDDAAGDLLEFADALADLGLSAPFVVVARAGLGTLNHAKLTVDAIRARGHRVAGVLIGSWPDAPDLATWCNIPDFPAYTGVPLLGALREGAGAGPDVLADAWIAPEALG